MLIDDLDVFGYNAANSYIIPELVNVDRFKAAVARTLTIFPLYAARVSCGGDGGVPWKITLPPKGIPLTISVSQETKIAPTDTIVQKPLRFLPPLNARQIVLDPEAPLAAILLTMFPKVGATSIGITRWHPIGSDYVANRFISALSKAYQGLALDVPHPVYKAARSYLPAPDSTYLKGVDTLAVKAYYPANSTHPQLDPSQPPNVRLDFRLSAKQTQQLHDSILALGGESPSFLTLQDCIVAFIVVATNAADSSNPPIHTIDTILDVRGAASIPSELSFNGFTFAPNRVTPRDWDDYYAYAAAVRKSIMRGRDPNFLAALTDLQARSRGDKQRGDNGLGQSTRTHDMQLDAPVRALIFLVLLLSIVFKSFIPTVHSLDEVMRPSIHFGHPGNTQSYVGTVPFRRHLKLPRPNPFLDESGEWVGRLDVTEVTLFFKASVRDSFVKEVNSRMKALGVEGDVKWVASESPALI
ncbi:hypothetical protein CYLTODRAFT_458368 [Cylindrobasidium torrendii FP15055 ss-10]|uniref:Uncharacterized protein n=1 Tax=Cylindrobasidium torrendii FP15055 ss-10 TaxID=1314674 RepID=A0A0D7AYV7_9AGAR|nr:hypothetical protein CYLTODRAFT_458368 [Cylindrobasidium torrendii FP15055 ss-10]